MHTIATQHAKPRRPGPRRLRTIEPAPRPRSWKEEVETLENVGGELGVVLWKSLRRIRCWAETEPNGRAGMFPPASPEVQGLMAAATVQGPELVEAIGVFAALLRAPERAEAKKVAEACNQVYRWADGRGMSRVALYFAEAAATVEPDNPTWAIDAGWMCRRIAVGGMRERSAGWYDRAFGLAVRSEDRQEVIRSLTEYGALMKDMGRYEKARSLYERAAQRARRTGRLRQAAVAHHYLLGLVAETGSYLQAERYARRALEQYPIHDPRIPFLAHDFAFALVRQCFYSHALPLLERILGVIPREDEQILALSSTARVAATTGRRERFEEARTRVLHLIEKYEEFAPAVLVNVAEGARALGEWRLAETYAKRAINTARSRKDFEPERVALELLSNITRREPTPPEAVPADIQRIELLSRRFFARLRRWRAPGLRRPGAGSYTDESPRAATGT